MVRSSLVVVVVASVVAVALEATPGRGVSGVTAEPATITRLTDPAWSPRRPEIAFDAEFETGTHQVAIVATDGSGLRLLEHSNQIGRPLWSPDGNTLALNGYDGVTPFVSAMHRVGDQPATSVGFGSTTPGSWSPDSTRLALIGFDPTDSPSGVSVVDASGAPSVIAEWAGYGPAWSSRNLVAYTWGPAKEVYGPEPKADFVYTSDVSGNHRRRLCRGSNPSWSSNGNLLAYTTARGVFVMRANGSDRRLVLPHVGTVWGVDHLRWAPGRPLIAVGRIIVDVARTRRWRLHLPKDVRGEPSWSPDGRRLVFAAGPRLYIIGFEGKGGHYITPA